MTSITAGTGKPTTGPTDPKDISKEDWAEGTGASPDDFPEQEGGPARRQPDPAGQPGKGPAERKDG